MIKEVPSKEVLYKLYIEDNLSRKKICSLLNITIDSLKNLLGKYGIKKPSSLVGKCLSKEYDAIHFIPCKEELYKLYTIEHRSVKELQEIYKQSNGVIRTWLHKYNLKKPRIPFASKETLYRLYVTEDKTVKEIKTLLNVSSKKVIRWLGKYNIQKPRINITYKDLYNAYIINNVSIPEVAKQFNVSGSTIRNLMVKYNIHKSTNLKGSCVSKTCIKKYGVSFYPSLGISKEVREILNNKEKLQSLIESLYSKTYTAVCKKLNINDTTVARYIRLHNLDYLINGHNSTLEQEIKDIFYEIPFIKNKDILEGKEIDLYSTEHKIGIEFNGSYWHSDKYKNRDYHKEKSLLAEKKGVFLFHIFEYEWANPVTKQAIVSRLNNLFNNNKIKVYARKCQIKEVDSKEAREFLNNNHTQGYAPSQVRLGLYNNNELVALMEFITNGINKNYEWELSRFCSKAGYNVVGGASKLFKHFIKTYNPKSIISYSDIAKTTGNIYKVLGFKLDHITNPQYHWVKSSITYTRYQCQLKELRKRGWLLPNEDKSENEVMREQGFSKIYDCGKKVWVWSA